MRVSMHPYTSVYPPYMAARMKKPAYGLNDAPRRWFNIIDASLRNYECVPTRGDRCTYVLYSKTQRASHKPTVSKSERPQIAGNEMLDKILHPFMPFVTEAVWQVLAQPFTL